MYLGINLPGPFSLGTPLGSGRRRPTLNQRLRRLERQLERAAAKRERRFVKREQKQELEVLRLYQYNFARAWGYPDYPAYLAHVAADNSRLEAENNENVARVFGYSSHKEQMVAYQQYEQAQIDDRRRHYTLIPT